MITADNSVNTALVTIIEKMEGYTYEQKKWVIGEYLNRCHSVASGYVEPARKREVHLSSQVTGERKAGLTAVQVDQELEELINLIGNEVNYQQTVCENTIADMKRHLENVQQRLKKIARSKSCKSIVELIEVIESDQQHQRARTDKSINDLLDTVISAFDPDTVLQQIGSDSADAKWLKKNEIYKAIENKHENIRQYKQSGKFHRDYWIMHKINGQVGL